MTELREMKPVEGRSCAGCTLCCKLLSISELNKPQQLWCEHCTIGRGCKIYDSKPSECSTFYCMYLVDARLDDAWKPSNCNFVMSFETHANRFVIHCDAHRRDAWRKQPFYSWIKNLSAMALQNEGQVVVWEGLDVVAVLPDREINLGRVGDGQLIITQERRTAFGVEHDVMVMDRDDPRIARVPQPSEDDPGTKST